MKTILILSSGIVASVASMAEPIISDVTARQGDGSRKVIASYMLGAEPAVVTVDVQTNRGDGIWVSIGAQNQVSITGDLNKLVQPGVHAIVWNAGKDWPNQKIDGGNIRFAVSAWATNAPPEYLAINLEGTTPEERVSYYASGDRVPGGLSDIRYKTTHILLKKIPAAGVEWMMGSPEDEMGRATTDAQWERQHKVILSDDYYIAIYPTTQKQYSYRSIWHRSHPNNQRATDGCPFGPEYDTYPVNRMYYTDYRGSEKGLGWPTNNEVDENSFFGWLRANTGLDFDLPTEAQWEFACRAGTTTAFLNGEDKKGEPTVGFSNIPDDFKNYVYFSQNSGGKMHPVGEKWRNAFGLYDMVGNAAEICRDWAGYYPAANVMVDPKGADRPDPLDLTANVLIKRGGYYNGNGFMLRSAYRALCKPQEMNDTITFRIVCPAVAK